MEIVIIVLCSFVLLSVVLLIILLLNNQKKNEQSTKINGDEFKEIGKLSYQLDNVSKDLKNDISKTVLNELNKVNEANNKNSENNNAKLERFQNGINESINKRFDALNKQIDDKFIEINKKVDERISEGFKSTSESMSQVRERLQAIDDAQKNIQALSSDVLSLKNVLEGNQSRGRYGEYQLSMVLHNVFGDTEGCYEEQYTMKKVKDGDDVRADAVVFMPEPNKMICIDSKFPFQDYSKLISNEQDENKDKYLKDFSLAVKKHITAIKDKYIVDGKTAKNAIMFIPNDGVFAFIHHECLDVIDYAREKSVILTSPSTLPSILITINMVRIEVERAKNAKIISEQLAKLGKQFQLFDTEWSRFSGQLASITKSKENLDKRVDRITTRFDSISGSNIQIEDDSQDKIEYNN